MTSRWLFLLLSMTLSAALPASVARADDEAALSDDSAPKKKKKKKKPAKRGFDYEKSKYKSFEEPQTKSYKFNENAEPIVEKKKTPSKKKKKRSEPPEIGSAESCGSEDNCAEWKSEADAL